MKRGERFQCDVKTMESTKASRPSDHESATESKLLAHRSAVDRGCEQPRVDPGWAYQYPALVDPEPDDLLGHLVGKAQDDVAVPQLRSLTHAFEDGTPTRPSYLPFLVLPDSWRLDEGHEWTLMPTRELGSSTIEKVVVLPDER